MTAPTCKLCSRVCAKSKGVYLPACSVCWENYLCGAPSDTGAMAQTAYMPPLERDGLKVPVETDKHWQHSAAATCERLGRKNPFHG